MMRAMLTRRAFLAVAGLAPLVRTPRTAAARYDILIRGGRVIDPAQRIDRLADVAIQGGRVAAVQPNIAADQAAEVIDARGRPVTPGLIDLHVPLGPPDLGPRAPPGDGGASA